MTRLLLVFGLLALAFPAWPQVQLEVVAGAPLQAVPGLATSPEGCRVVPKEKGALVSCPEAGPLRVWLQRDGFEPRLLAAHRWTSPLVLDEEGWVALPVSLRLWPESRWRGLAVLWVQGREVSVGEVVEGMALGPRLGKGSKAQALVVGPEVQAQLVELAAEDRGRERSVELLPGRSHAFLCFEPWEDRRLPSCQLQLGRVPSFLKRVGDSFPWHLPREGELRELAGVTVADLAGVPKDARLWVRAEAEGFPPFLLAVEEENPVTRIVFPQGAALRVRLEDSQGQAVRGWVRIAREVEGLLVLLAEEKTDEQGEARLSLAPGRYQVIASAQGAGVARQELVLSGKGASLTFSLGAAEMAEGVVVDEQGHPLAGVSVVALSAKMQMASPENFAQTDAQGIFRVNLPGEGPWLLRAERSGYAPAALSLDSPAKGVQLVLSLRCRVRLLLSGPGGLPVAGNVVALRLEAADAQPGQNQGNGSYLFHLTPGRWQLLAEEEGLSGVWVLPKDCQELQQALTLAPWQKAVR